MRQGYDENMVWQGPAFPAPTDTQRAAMGYIVAPYVHSCCPGSCTCVGRLARYIPASEESGLEGALAAAEAAIPSRPYSKRELRHQAARERAYRRFVESGGAVLPRVRS